MPTDELQPLRQAVDGLLFPSESDEPFDVIDVPAGPSVSTPLEFVRQKAEKRTAVEVKIDDFFSALAGSEEEERFKNLRQALQSTLTDLHIFRIGDGEPRVDVYLVGKKRAG